MFGIFWNNKKQNNNIEIYENNKNRDKEYWGIGIENESYMMFNKLVPVPKEFIINNCSLFCPEGIDAKEFKTRGTELLADL